MPKNTSGSSTLAATVTGAVVGGLVTLAAVYALGWRPSPESPGAIPAMDTAHEHADRAEMVHEMGGHVMPFSLEKTTHVFQMTATGGIQDVVIKDSADSAQIPLIRQHLRHEAMSFGHGDFSDPSSLHGADMPGLREMAAAGDRLQVEYTDLPDGGRISYVTEDPALVTAVHRWFGAQLSDHGSDATYR